MAEGTPTHHVRETNTLRFARFVVRNRAIFGSLLIFLTLFFFYPTLNAITSALGYRLPGPATRVDTNARDFWPDHPFIHAQDKFAGEFGTASTVAIALVVKDGNVFTPETLEKIYTLTQALDGVGVDCKPEEVDTPICVDGYKYRYDSQTEARETLREQLEEDESLTSAQILQELDRIYPPYPVNHDQVRSVSHRSTRVVQIEPDGAITSDILMKKVPDTQPGANEIRELVRQNPPFIFGRLVSWDEKGALITAGFVTDRLSGREVYQAVFDHVQAIKAGEEDENHEIYVSGEPILVGWILKHAFEIVQYLVLTILVIFGLLWLYFRRWHGVFIPFIAAIATVIWGLGYTGWRGITFDPLILVIPMIITARAVSHTVQMAERFFEDYEIMLPQVGDPQVAKTDVATVAMAELIVPGTLGIVTDVAGLLVILVTSIPQMRNLGEFGAFWVASIIATVEFLHPILICYMPAPTEHEHFLPGFMVRFTRFIGDMATHPVYKYVIGAITIILFSGSTYITLYHSKIGESRPGTPLLFPDHEFNEATAAIADKFGGIDFIVVYVNGDRDNASADPEPIRRIEQFERFLQVHTNLGASVSLAPILAGYWRQQHYGDPKWRFIPESPGTLRAAVFQLQTNGPPGFLRPYMTDDARNANIRFFYPDHKGDTIMEVVAASEHFIEENPIGEVIVRLDQDHASPDAGWLDYDKLTDIWYYMLGPLLPPRNHTLNVRIRQEDGTYLHSEVEQASQTELPAWIEEFRAGATEDYENELFAVDEGEVFSWPETLADWSTDDVDQWWESEEFGIRAVGVNTKDLIVYDLKAVDGVPSYQPTNSWTRGVQFVMAGGVMGILAAINDEVERSHVANISLIFFVIFVLHSVTYKSMPSGAIILLQIATATLLSLAYMAIQGIGLNINTLPVQSVGVGIGVDYAIYIVDRIRQEVLDTEDIDEAVRRAVRTTGMAVTFTATTIVGGIVLWSFSNLRFQAEMAQLLSILMVINMLGAITVVPTFYSILRPKVATELLREEQEHATPGDAPPTGD
jgi:predicted RND superfamily exporter protein